MPPAWRAQADGVVLLRELAGGVAAPRVAAGVLVDELPGERRRRTRGRGLEVAGLEGGDAAGPAAAGPVVAAGVAALAVHDHRGGEHQPVDPGSCIAARSAAVPRSLWPA